MDVTVKDFSGIIILIGSVAGALITIGLLTNFLVVKPIRRWMDREFAPKILAPLQLITQEVTENQGRSMKDALVRVEYHISTLDKRFDDHIVLHGQVIKTED